MMINLTGNTYAVKDQIKAMGGKWNAERKTWAVPANKVKEAQKLISEAGSSSKASVSNDKCAKCSKPSKGYRYCYQCSLEYRDGGSRHANGQSYYNSHGRFVLGDDD